ncbi:MAG: HNH endonuclease [Bacteroidota bacterium]
MNDLRNCLKEPINEIFEAAQLLSGAVNSHLAGNKIKAEELILKANNPLIYEWTESIWGSNGIYSALVKKYGTPSILPKELRDPRRMPTKTDELILLQRDGFHCRFCGIPVIKKETRDFLNKQYPLALSWGKTNKEKHAAFQTMWVQFDHITPHARGGKTDLNNLIITCAPCNYGRMNFLLDEIGLKLNPLKAIKSDKWDGLERVFIRHQ